MAEDFVQVNIPATAGKKLKTWSSIDGALNVVESEAVTLTDSSGAEVVPATEVTLAAVLARQADGTAHTIVDNFPATVAVTGPLTDVELRAVPVPVSGSVTVAGPIAVTGPLTDAELRASDVPVSVSGAVAITNAALDVALSTRASDAGLLAIFNRQADGTAHTIVDGPVAVTGPLTDAEIRATPLPVSGPLTDVELRASAVPVSGTLAVTGALTDAELRATPVPVSGTVAVTNADLDVALSTRASEATLAAVLARQADGTAHTIVDGTVPVTGPLTDAQLRASAVPVSSTQLPAALVGARLDTNTGAWLGSTAPTVGSKTSASSVPVVIASDQAAIPVSGTVAVTGALTDTQLRATPVPVSGTVAVNVGLTDAQLRATPVPVSGTVAVTNADLDVALSTRASEATLAAVSAQLPAALVGARLDANAGAWLGSTAPTVGSKTSANSVPVVIASDQAAITVTGALTDTQLRATPVPVSGPLTDTQLRATAVPVSSTQLPAALVGSRLDANIGAWLGSTAPTVGSKTSANSVPVVIANDQAAIAVGKANSATGALGALAATVAITTTTSQVGVAYMFLPIGAPLSGTVVAEWSPDGVIFFATYFAPLGGTRTTFLLNPTVTNFGRIIVPAGATSVRLRVSLYTSGSVTGFLSATGNIEGTLLAQGLSGNPLSPETVQIGGSDGGNLVTLKTDTTGRLSILDVSTSALANGVETAVAGVAVQVLASNASRKAAQIQNTGTANIRVGIAAVTATTGLQLTPGATMVLSTPFVPTGAVFAIREGAVSSIAFAMEQA